jgi:hypothetical protein
MRVTGETASCGDIDQPQRSAGKQSLGFCQAQIHQKLMRRLARRGAKFGEEMRPAITTFRGQGRKVQISAIIYLTDCTVSQVYYYPNFG